MAILHHQPWGCNIPRLTENSHHVEDDDDDDDDDDDRTVVAIVPPCIGRVTETYRFRTGPPFWEFFTFFGGGIFNYWQIQNDMPYRLFFVRVVDPGILVQSTKSTFIFLGGLKPAFLFFDVTTGLFPSFWTFTHPICFRWFLYWHHHSRCFGIFYGIRFFGC
jgi:hypothetical protein